MTYIGRKKLQDACLDHSFARSPIRFGSQQPQSVNCASDEGKSQEETSKRPRLELPKKPAVNSWEEGLEAELLEAEQRLKEKK